MGEISQDISTAKKTKHIVSNTIVLFVRVLLITLINLYSVRYILNGLGKLDFGVYNSVASVVLTATCFIPVFALSVQRFYSYEIGKKNFDKLPDIFSASFNIIFVISLAIFLVLETGGLYYVNNYMTLPAVRMEVVNIIFHFIIISLVFTLLQIPYTAAVFSHEDMNIYAIVSCVDCLLRFAVAFCITGNSIDHLLFYSLGIMSVTLITFCTYAFVSHARYKECRFKKIEDNSIYKKLLSFSGWTFYGALSGTAIIQGGQLILNFFFGPIANAAYGIANHVYNAINSTSNSVVLSFRPAMVKAYAENNFSYLNSLFTLNNKFILYFLSVAAIPMISEMDTILNLWLKNISETDILFSRLFVVYPIVLAMHNPITTIIQSTGKISNYYFWVETINIMAIPAAWILFKMGLPSYYLFVAIISVCLIAHVVRLVCLKQVYETFSVIDYFVRIIIPGIIIIALSSFATYFIHSAIDSSLLRLLVVFVTSPIVSLALMYYIGLSQLEKQTLRHFATKTFKKITKR